MAADYTTNYNLDKYTANDKPNLRDQYNSAMDKIDAQLLVASNDATLAVTKAQQALDHISDSVTESEFNTFVSQTNTALAGKASTTALNNEVSARQSAVSSEATARANADTALGQRIDNLAGADTIVLIGDSWSNANHDTFVWANYLAARLNVRVENKAKNGASFCRPNLTFLEQIQATTTPTSRVKTILVVGGINDIIQNYDSNIIYDAVDAFISAVKSKYPNKECVFFGIQDCLLPQSSYANLHYRAATTGISIRKKFQLAGFRAYNIQNDLIGFDNVFQDDNLHPTALGHRLLLSSITGKLTGAKQTYPRELPVTMVGAQKRLGAVSTDGENIIFDLEFQGDFAAGNAVLARVDSPAPAFIHTYTVNANSFVFLTVSPRNLNADGKLRAGYIQLQQNGTIDIGISTNSAITGGNVRMTGIAKLA